MNKLIRYQNINRFHIPDIMNFCSYDLIYIGLYKGEFCENILYKTRKTVNKVIGVDPYQPLSENVCGFKSKSNNIIISQKDQDDNKFQCLNKLFKNPKFEYVNMSSYEYGKSLEDESINFVYLDGDHSEDGVYKDLEIFYQKIKPGGILCGHDYGGDFGKFEPVVQVKKSVDKFCNNYQIKYTVTTPGYCSDNECIQSFFIIKI